MSTAQIEIERHLCRLLAPPPQLRLSDYSEQYYRLSPESSAETGEWRCIPYQRGILDAFSDPEVEVVSCMKSARVGWSKILNIVAMYYMHYDKCPIMMVQPTIPDAEDYSAEEIEPMLRDVPVMAALFGGANSKQKILRKRFPGGSLSLVGANSPRGFRRVSRRVVLFDEVDGYPAAAGVEGDQLLLGKQRAQYYWDRKIGVGSTPTVDGHSRIQVEFSDGDQRRFYVPCPHCGHMDFLVHSPQYQRGMHWDYEDTLRGHFMLWPKDEPEKAHFVCRQCDSHIDHKHKRDMVEAGEWRARKPFKGHASFAIWAAYSYSPNASWGQIATEYATAARKGPEALKTVVNTVLGETWTEKSDAPEWEVLYRRREDYQIGRCPRGVLFLTCGVDVQKDSLRYEVVGWGREKRSWSIDIGVLPGDTSNLGPTGPWPQVDALLDRAYPHECGTSLRISMLAVDSGWNTMAVYAWGLTKPMNRVMAVKGGHSDSVLVSLPTTVDVDWQGQKILGGYRMWNVGSSAGKTELYGWIRMSLPIDEGVGEPPGYCHFPRYDEEYFKQLTSEQLITHRTRKGRLEREWVVIAGRENHYLDARIYARCAAYVVGIDRFQESDWIQLERDAGYDQPPPAPPSSAQHQPAPAQSGGWIPRRPGYLRKR
jgi:phage terminase large subunit GpA-like protein